MEDFLCQLRAKTYRNRKVAIVENGTWAPSAACVMKGYLEAMKNIQLCDLQVTIPSAVKEATVKELEALAGEVSAM